MLLCVEKHGVTSRWKKLGVYLRIPLPRLDVIEADHAKTDDRVIDMLGFWLKTGSATKQELISALREITKTSAD